MSWIQNVRVELSTAKPSDRIGGVGKLYTLSAGKRTTIRNLEERGRGAEKNRQENQQSIVCVTIKRKVAPFLDRPGADSVQKYGSPFTKTRDFRPPSRVVGQVVGNPYTISICYQ